MVFTGLLLQDPDTFFGTPRFTPGNINNQTQRLTQFQEPPFCAWRKIWTFPTDIATVGATGAPAGSTVTVTYTFQFVDRPSPISNYSLSWRAWYTIAGLPGTVVFCDDAADIAQPDKFNCQASHTNTGALFGSPDITSDASSVVLCTPV